MFLSFFFFSFFSISFYSFLWLCKIQHLQNQRPQSPTSPRHKRTNTAAALEATSPLHSFVYGMRRLLQTNASSHVLEIRPKTKRYYDESGHVDGNDEGNNSKKKGASELTGQPYTVTIPIGKR